MLRRILLLLLVIAGVAAAWIWRSTQPSSDRPAPATPEQHGPADRLPVQEPEHLSVPAESAAVEPVRAQALPSVPAPQAQPQPPVAPEPPKPLPGAGVDAIFGGAEAYATFYREVAKEGRLSRVSQLEEVLGQYEGDPKEPSEFEKYEAFKEELEWLRAHPED